MSTHPSKIVCVGRNYEEHAKELALQYFLEEYPDFDGVVVSVEQNQ